MAQGEVLGPSGPPLGYASAAGSKTRDLHDLKSGIQDPQHLSFDVLFSSLSTSSFFFVAFPDVVFGLFPYRRFYRRFPRRRFFPGSKALTIQRKNI